MIMKPVTPASRFPRWKTLLATVTAAVGALVTARATPVYHGISAGNVAILQNDTSNNAVSITEVGTLLINDFHITNGATSGNSRADYFVQIGTNAFNNVTNGILISSITDNGRDNGEGDGINYGTSAVDSNSSSNPGSNGQWWVPVFGSSTKVSATFPEYNFDFAAAYFPYAKGWFGGWLVNKGGTNNAVTTNLVNDHWIGNTNLILGTDVLPQGGGKVNVNLLRFGLDSRSNAVMICCGGKNEENFAVSQTNADGTWSVTTRDDVSGSAEGDPNAFVCVPLTNHLVISGRFMGDAKIALQSAPFYVTNTAVGTYHLVIPGVTPGHGVLIISGESGGTYNSDNIVSYQATADGWDIQTRDSGSTATAAAPNLQNLPGTDSVVSFVYIPAPTPGVSVSPTNGLVTSENGAAASFTVVLDALPTTNVTIAVSTSDTTLGIVSTNSLVFSTNNWNVPQTVTVTGVTNTIANGGIHPYTVNLGAAVSADTNYNGFQPVSVAVANVNNNLPGVAVWPTNGLVTTEGGGTASFSVLLNSQPTANVTIALASSNANEGTNNPASVTFTANNWNTPQLVTVTGVDDAVVDGSVAYSIVASPAVSTDGNYSGLTATTVGAVNLDNEVAGVTVSAGSAISVIEGSSTNFTVALTAKPVANVVITYTSGNPSVGTIAPASLTFTANNWNTPQTVTLSGVSDSVNSGAVSYPISAAITTTNPGYASLVLSNLTATTLLQTAILFTTNQSVYGFGMSPVGLDGQALVLETSASSFTGASLTAAVVTNGQVADVLSIRNDGTNDGQINVAGNTVSYGATPIATFSGGTGLTPLAVTFQSGTPVIAAQALVRALAFGTTATNLAPRTVRVTLNDGLGNVIFANKSVRVGLLRTLAFQNGFDYGYGTYGSEANIEVSQVNPNTPYPTGDNPANGLFVDAPTPGIPNETQVLLRYDNLIGTNVGQIPPGSLIVSAELDINIINSGNGAKLNRMLIPWDATNSTWNVFTDAYGDTGIFADDLTAQSEFDSQLGVYIVDPNTGAVSGGTTGNGYVGIGVTPDIQAWANGQTNYGWFLHGWPQETDGLGFSSGQDATPANRPSLRVYWLPAGTASTSFRYGVNGYTNVYDTNLRQAAGDINYATETTLWSDANDVGVADQTEALIQFNNLIGTDAGQIPPNAHIEAAVLDLASINSSAAMGNGGQFFAMLQPWQDTNTTWNAWGAAGIVNNGVQAAVNPTATAGNSVLSPKYQAANHTFDVTTDVQNWSTGTLPDYGWAIIPWVGGSDGWGMNSSEDPATNSRPQLRVYYTFSGIAVARPVIQSLTYAGGQAQVTFTGTASTTYNVWRTTTVKGGWAMVGTATTDGNGSATYTDSTSPAAAAYYRISY